MRDKDFLASRKLEFGPELGSIICSCSRPDNLVDWAQAFLRRFAYLYASIDSGTGQIFDVDLAYLVDVSYVGGWRSLRCGRLASIFCHL